MWRQWSDPVPTEVMAMSFNLPIVLHSSAIEAPLFAMRALDNCPVSSKSSSVGFTIASVDSLGDIALKNLYKNSVNHTAVTR